MKNTCETRAQLSVLELGQLLYPFKKYDTFKIFEEEHYFVIECVVYNTVLKPPW